MLPHRPSSSAHFISPQQAQQAAQALTYALSNPYNNTRGPSSYGYNQNYQYSSHYSQAYSHWQTGGSPLTTPEGYSISSTYAPDAVPGPNAYNNNSFNESDGYSASGAARGGLRRTVAHTQAHWYTPGNNKCSFEQCTFTGSKKSVEIHMMDRHLIYPQGWEKRKRKSDWDADPSLNNGKPIPIQGTSIILDTPEAIDAWIEERRKRWPTVSRAKEKTQKLEDAIARGQIVADDSLLRSRKRPRRDDSQGISRGRGLHNRRGTSKGRGGLSRDPVSFNIEKFAEDQSRPLPHALPKKPVTSLSVNVVDSPDGSSDEDPTSGSDMDPEKDAISSKPPITSLDSDKLGTANGIKLPSTSVLDMDEKKTHPNLPQRIQPAPRRHALQPKGPRANLFANRPSLLRNLLLPDIRMTVSNLSQAIHFLNENDFLEGVELKPGDADNQLISVLNESDDT